VTSEEKKGLNSKEFVAAVNQLAYYKPDLKGKGEKGI